MVRNEVDYGTVLLAEEEPCRAPNPEEWGFLFFGGSRVGTRWFVQEQKYCVDFRRGFF